MKPQFDPLIISLFRIMYIGEYDALIELIWDNKRQDNLEAHYSLYKESLYQNLKSTHIEEERRIQVINSCLYIRDEIIPEIIANNDWNGLYFSVKNKIDKYKFNWENLVEIYLRNENDKKYILKECKEQKISDNKNKKSFIKSRLEEIKKWATNKDTLLSEFYYLDDLQKNQLNVILQTEPTFIILHAILNNNADDLKKLLSLIEDDKKSQVTKKGGQVPNLVLTDGIFRVSPIKILDDDPNVYEDEEEGKLILSYDNLDKPIKIAVPKSADSHELNSSFDYTKDIIYQGKFELATLTAILQIGSEQILKSNSITFTFSQICELFNQPPSTRIYSRIAKALFYLKLNLYTVKLGDNYTRYFNIISAVEQPTFNSKREKEWTIEIDAFLREQILQSHYTVLFAEDISSFAYELSPILFRIFVIDKQDKPNMEMKEYTLRELTKRTFLNGKPNVRKKRIINSLEEIKSMNNSVIKDYKVKDDSDIFEIYFSNSSTFVLQDNKMQNKLLL